MCQRTWPPLLTNMTSLKSVPIQFCRCKTFIEGKNYREDGNPEVASSQDWPPLQNTIQFWEEHYFITTRKVYIQTPSIHCYFWESTSWYVPNDKGLYRKIQRWRKAKLMLCHFKLFPTSREISPQVLSSPPMQNDTAQYLTLPVPTLSRISNNWPKVYFCLQMVRRFADPNQNFSLTDTAPNIKEP